MSESEVVRIPPSEIAAATPENEPIQTVTSVLGYRINWDKGPQKITIDPTTNTVTINPERFNNPDQAEFVAATAAMRQSEFEDILRTEDQEEIRQILGSEPDVISDLALWSAVRRLQSGERRLLNEVLTRLPAAGSFVTETKNACFRYLAIGSLPDLSPELEPFFTRLPVSASTGRIPLDAMADSAITIQRRLEYYGRFIRPILEQARSLDRQLERTVSDSFKPNTEESGGEPLDESEILQRIYPFYGGYFREQVFDGIDWENMRVIATEREAENYQGSEIEDGSSIKRYRFTGSNGQDIAAGTIALPLPAGAELCWDSLTSGFVIKKDNKGISMLALDVRANLTTIPADYEFQFIIQDNPAFQFLPPTDGESIRPPDDIFSTEKQGQLADLAKLSLAPQAVAKRLASQIHQEIEYVNSDEVGTLLSQAGRDYFKVLESVKKADCDVSNFYLVAQLRSLGIAARVVTGYYVTDKSFGFSPLAGIKHFWTEYFDEPNGLWRCIDATPPKKEDEKDEEDGEARSGTGGDEMQEQIEDGETSFEGDIEDEGLELNDEQLQQLREYIQQKTGEITENAESSKRRVNEAFLVEYGVSKEEWERVLEYINKVNQMPVPREQTIEKVEDSTLGEEWEKFFDLFLTAYRIPAKTKVTQVRQSLGDDLVDPSSAAIDLLSGSDDPYGFEKVKKGEQEIKLPIDFSNDFLLDLTSSMEATDSRGLPLKEYQRQFVMSALYHGFQINEQLKYYAGELSELSFISNHLLSIHGAKQYKELTTGEKEITMTQLAELFQLLSKTEQGAGAMVSALQAYRDRLFSRPDVIDKIQRGTMVKTLTILSDGNLWCSACGLESCSYSLHASAIAQAKSVVGELRDAGVVVNAIGFTNQSRPIVEMFDNPTSAGAAVVVADTSRAIVAHHGQMVQSWEIIKKAAEFRKPANL